MANERIKATDPMLRICFVDGGNVVKTRCLVEKWTFVDKFMGDQSITFSVSSAEPIDWHVGDYCEFRGERYTLNYIPSVTQKARKGSHGEAFTYEGVKLDSYSDDLTRCQLLDITPTTGLYVDCVGTNHTGSSNFTLYCGETRLSVGGNEIVFPAVCVLAGKIQANLDRLYGAGVWSVFVETSATYINALGQEVLVTHTDAKLLSFDNKTVADALGEVHNTFDLDYCIKGCTIYIGYSMAALSGTASFTDDLSKSDVEKEVFFFGYGNGYPTMSDQGTALFQLKRIANSQQKIVTRLRVLGSTKNLPYRYYNERYSTGTDDLSQTLFPLNLQLPGTFLPEGSESDAAGTDSKWGQHKSRNNAYLRRVKGGTNDSYIDKDDDAGGCVEGIREASVRFDGSDSNLPEIYPTIEDATYSDLRAGLVADQSGVRGSGSFPGYSDDEYVDELLAVGYPSGSTLIDDANNGSGILPESGYSGNGVSRDCTVRAITLEYRVRGTHDFSNWGDRWAGPEVTLCTFRNITPGRYVLVNTDGGLFFGFSGISCYRDGCSAKIGFMLRIKQKYTENGIEKSDNLLTYTSTLFATDRSSSRREISLPNIPSIPNDEHAEIRDSIVVTQSCLLEVTLIPIMRDVSVPEGFVDNFGFAYEVGNSKVGLASSGLSEYTLIDQDEASALAGSFHVFVKDMGFDIEAQWGGDTPTLTMRSGSCTGRAFEIGSIVEKVTFDGKKGYLLTLKRAEDSGLNTYYPSCQDPIAAGDRFVLTGVSMPDAYVQMAELRLLKAATQYLADNSDTVFTYQPYIDDLYLQRNYDRCLLAGHEEKSIFWRLYAGLRFTFRGIPSSSDDDEELPLCDISIEQVTIKMGESPLPQVELLLNDDVQQTTLQKLTTSVDRIYNGSIFSSGSVSSDGTAMNTAALVALLQCEGDKRYLSKRTDDEASGHITFSDGITVHGEAKANDALIVKGETRSKGGVKVGDFRSRLLGSGALIDESGNAEFESIYARNFISTPEFRFNRIRVADGEEWCTNGYGTVKHVEQTGSTSGIITLQLEENDYASIAIGDLCRGVYNNFGFAYATSDLDDDSSLYGTGQGETSGGTSEGSGFGFSSRQGFFTSYFCIVRILTYERGSCSFEYELRNSHTPHPCKFMRFAQYGNRDANSGRCSSSYQSSVGRYFEMILDGVTTWRIQSSNVVLRKGYLGNMTVTMVNDNTGETYDQTLEGYGLYVQNNVYSNKLIQVDPYTLAMLEEDLKSYSVELTEHVDVITVDDAGNVIGGLYTESGEGSNKVRNWRIHSAISVFKNNDLLRLADAGEDAGPGTYTLSALKRDCDCFFDNSTIYITKINNLNDGDPLTPDISDFAAMRSMESCCVDITIDCEGMGTIVKRFPITVKHSSEPVVSADLDNEFSGVSWNSKRGVYIGLPVVTELTMWRNNEYLDVTGIAAHLSQSIQTDDGQNVGIVTSGAAAELSESELSTKIVYTGSLVNVTKFAGSANEVTYKVGRVEITRLPNGLPKIVNLNITGTSLYSGVSYERTLVHTINKSTDTNVYQIVPSVSEVSVVYNANREKVPTVRVLRCVVKCSSTDDQHFDLQSGGALDQVTNYLDRGMMLIYRPYLVDANYAETGGDEYLYDTVNGISIGTAQLAWRRIEFRLLKLKDATLSTYSDLRASSNIDAELDTESVPFVLDGDDGASQPSYTETQEAWSNASSVASPTSEPTPNGGWSNYTPANSHNYSYLWRRSRLRTLNASRNGYDGENGSWTYTRLSGTNGTSINSKGTVVYVADSSGNLPSTGVSSNDLAIVVGSSRVYNASVNNGTATWSAVSDASDDGDCYVVSGSCTYDGEQVSGHMFMWSAEANNGAGSWIDLGQFKGDNGKTYYTHIAWADAVTFNAGKTAVTSVTGFSIGIGVNDESKPWMGICIDENANDSNLLGSTDVESANHFKWKYMRGKDGDGLEYVFARTKGNSAPHVYADSSDREDSRGKTPLQDDYLPRVYVTEETEGGVTVQTLSGNGDGGSGQDHTGSDKFTTSDGNIIVECTDEPVGTSAEWPYEWVLTRRRSDGHIGVSHWDAYSGAMSHWTNWVSVDHHVVKCMGGVGSYAGGLLVDGNDATGGMALHRGINLFVLNPITLNREYTECYDVCSDADNGTTTNTDGLISALNTYGTDGKIVVLISGNYNDSSGIYIHDRLWVHLSVVYGVGVDLRTSGKVSESLAIICQQGMEAGQAIVRRGSAVSIATVSVSGGELIVPGSSVLPVGTNIIKQSGFTGLSAWENHACTVYMEGFDGSNVVRLSPSGFYQDCLTQEVATPDGAGMFNDRWYTLSFYASGGDMLTYFHDMLMASGERYYVDGVPYYPGDGLYTTARASWSFDNVMRLHRMTFKTKSRITYMGAYDSSHSYSKLEMVSVESGGTTRYYVSMKDSNQGNAVASNTAWWREGTASSTLQADGGQSFMRRVMLLFRKESGTGDTYLSKVKLEEGPWATGWQANESDRQGMPGCRERVFEVYTRDMVYYNEDGIVKSGVRYVDFMAIEDAESASGYAVYRCKQTHLATALSFAGDLSNWEAVDVNYAAAFFTYLIAKNAHLKFLSSNAIEIIDSETIGGVSQRLVKAFFGNGEYPLWLGGTTIGNGSDAPFRVQKNGRMFATGAEVSGTIKADNLFHGVCLYGVSGQKLYYYVEGPSDPSDLDEGFPYPYTIGTYITEDDFDDHYSDSLGLLGPCSGPSDIIIVPNRLNNTATRYVNLPRACDFEGKIIELYDSAYSNVGSIGVIIVSAIDGGYFSFGIYSQSGPEYAGTACTLNPGTRTKFLSVCWGGQWYWLKLE